MAWATTRWSLVNALILAKDATSDRLMKPLFLLRNDLFMNSSLIKFLSEKQYSTCWTMRSISSLLGRSNDGSSHSIPESLLTLLLSSSELVDRYPEVYRAMLIVETLENIFGDMAGNKLNSHVSSIELVGQK